MPLRKPSEFNPIDSHRGAEDAASGPYPESLHTHTCTNTDMQHTSEAHFLIPVNNLEIFSID